MKTEAIRGVLERVLENPAAKSDPLVQAALAEVDDIEQVVHDQHNGRPHDCRVDDDCDTSCEEGGK